MIPGRHGPSPRPLTRDPGRGSRAHLCEACSREVAVEGEGIVDPGQSHHHEARCVDKGTRTFAMPPRPPHASDSMSSSTCLTVSCTRLGAASRTARHGDGRTDAMSEPLGNSGDAIRAVGRLAMPSPAGRNRRAAHPRSPRPRPGRCRDGSSHTRAPGRHTRDSARRSTPGGANHPARRRSPYTGRERPSRPARGPRADRLDEVPHRA